MTEHGIDMVTINPSLVIGPPASSRVDGTSIGGIKGLMEGKQRKLNFNVVDVRDVADAHIQAMERYALDYKTYLVSNMFAQWQIGGKGPSYRQLYPRIASRHVRRDFEECVSWPANQCRGAQRIQ